MDSAAAKALSLLRIRLQEAFAAKVSFETQKKHFERRLGIEAYETSSECSRRRDRDHSLLFEQRDKSERLHEEGRIYVSVSREKGET